MKSQQRETNQRGGKDMILCGIAAVCLTGIAIVAATVL